MIEFNHWDIYFKHFDVYYELVKSPSFFSIKYLIHSKPYVLPQM